MLSGVDLIIVDGDDTIWYDRRYFSSLYGRIRRIVGEANSAYLNMAVKNSSAGEAGFINAVRGYIESLGIEDASEVDSAIAEFANHPMELLPGARAALRTLSSSVQLILYTSGIRSEQERKISRSGIGNLFGSFIIVESKTEKSLGSLIDSLGVDSGATIAIGNSLKYDILPALAIGLRPIWLNHEENKHGRDAVRPEDVLEISAWDDLMRL